MKTKIIFVLFLTTLLSGCLNNTVNEEDFNFNAKWDWEYNNNERGSHFADGVFHDQFLIKTASNTDEVLWYRIYIDNSEDESTKGRTPYIVDRGFPYYLIKLTPQTIEQSKEIKICVSLDSDFNKNDEGVVCKSVTLPQRKIDFEVTPSPVSFKISKGVFGEQYEWITVKNTGDIGLTIQISPPNDKSLNYPVYKPKYGTRDNTYDKLNPGESRRYKIYAYVHNYPQSDLPSDIKEMDTPIGTYYSEGYVCALYDNHNSILETANYKKTFTLETIVVN